METKSESLKVKYLTACYHKQANETLKNLWLKENVKLKTDYVNLERKMNIVESIINTTMFDNGNFHQNSIVQSISLRMNLINLYLNVDIDFEHIIDEFDMLNKYGLIEVLLSIIPERELKEFYVFVEMANRDVIANEHDPYSFITKNITNLISSVSKTIDNLSNNLEAIIKNMDEEKIEKLLPYLQKIFTN